MPTYFALDAYSPVLSLVLGVMHLAGMMAVGHGLLKALRIELPRGWMAMLAIATGVQAVALALILLAVAQLTSPLVLKAVAAALLITGVLYAALGWLPLLLVWRRSPAAPFERWEWLSVGVLAVAVVPAVFGALAPVSKADELRYHMLLADRILLDGGFRFYQYPWPGAILPHMGFQLTGLPLHAIGQPFAHAVTAFVIIVAFFVFAYSVLRELEVPRVVVLLGFAAMWAGPYPVVWWASPASHSFGEVCGAMAVLLLVLRRRLLESWNPVVWYGALGVFATGMAISKLSLLVLVALTMAAGALLLALDGSARRRLPAALAVGFVVGLVFYVPWLLITHAYSGSPWGPIYAGKFGPSVYDVEFLNNAGILRSRELNMDWNIRDFLKGDFLYVALPCWVLMAWGFANREVPVLERVLVAGLLIAQIGVILKTVGTEIRFIGGLRFALMMLALGPLSAWLAENTPTTRRAAHVVLALMLLPWLGVAAYFSRSFVPPVVGLKDARAALTPLTYYLDDYAKIDELLPRDAVIVTYQTWNNSVLYPRPVYMELVDVPEGKRPHLMFAGELEPRTLERIAPYTPGPVVYHSEQSLHLVGRSPFAKPEYKSLTVVELLGER